MTAPDGAPAPGPGARSPRVRPYTITGGRTRTRTRLALETLVQASEVRDPGAAAGNERTIQGLCVRPISVAEVAARSGLPLGVTRVLLDDMARAGRVTLHVTLSDRPDRELMERVLDGLQRL